MRLQATPGPWYRVFPDSELRIVLAERTVARTRNRLSALVATPKRRYRSIVGLVAVEALVALLVVPDEPAVALVLGIGTAATLLSLVSSDGMFLAAFAAKPLIDTLWLTYASVGGVRLNAQSAVGVAVPLVALALVARKGVRLPRQLVVPMAAFALIAAHGATATRPLVNGAEGFFRACGALALFAAFVARPVRSQNVRPWVMAFLAATAVVMLPVLGQLLGLIPYTSREGAFLRATGFYYHPWDVARYLLVAVPLALLVFDDPRSSTRERIASGVLLAILALATYATFLKLAWILVFVEVLVWSIVTRSRGRTVTLTALALAVVALASDTLAAVFYDVGKLFDPAVRTQALSGRLYLWQHYLAWWFEAPARVKLLGAGFAPAIVGELKYAPHNDVVSLLVHLGVLGLGAYAWVMGALLATISRARTAIVASGASRWFHRHFALATILVTASYLASGLTTDAWTYPSLNWYVWILGALVVSTAAASREAHGESDERQAVTPRVVVVGPLPPPMHGVANATVRIVSSPVLCERLSLLHLDTSDRRDLGNMGRIDLQNLVLAARHLAQLVAMCVIHRPHLVYYTLSQNPAALVRDTALRWTAWLFGADSVVHLRGSRYADLARRRDLTGALVRRALREATTVLVLGESQVEPIAEVAQHRRIAVVPNGLAKPPAAQDPVSDAGPCVFTFLGAVRASKGALLAIRAVGQAVRSGADARLVFAGEPPRGEELTHMHDEIRDAGIEDRVVLRGTVSGDDKWRLLRETDVFLLPSYAEGQPWSILEAMAVGLPVISTRVGAVPDTVVDGVTGILVEPGDEEALANAVTKLALRPDVRHAMGAAARARVTECFTLEHVHALLRDRLVEAAATQAARRG